MLEPEPGAFICDDGHPGMDGEAFRMLLAPSHRALIHSDEEPGSNEETGKYLPQELTECVGKGVMLLKVVPPSPLVRGRLVGVPVWIDDQGGGDVGGHSEECGGGAQRGMS